MFLLTFPSLYNCRFSEVGQGALEHHGKCAAFFAWYVCCPVARSPFYLGGGSGLPAASNQHPTQTGLSPNWNLLKIPGVGA